MSRNIETNVVEMQFDNAKFEKNVKESMSTLDKLKSALNFSESSKSLKNLEKATNNVNFQGITNGIQTVTAKFSALEVAGVTALANITNRAVNAGIALTKSLSIDQITSGWGKYADKMASVQTIMNATGKNIDEVSSYLEELMWFSDETSYGFNNMTSALATMTASGGQIETLIPMITGVANATAFAGKGAAEFSRVMYNINQSYSQGFLSLMDWKSVQMAGAASKQLMLTLISSAEELGKIEKGSITLSNFTTSLANRWADTEVMEKAFGKFSEMSTEAYKLVQAGQFDTASEAIEHLSGKYSDLGENAFKAAQEAKTFSEAIDATKDAVSSKWSQIFEVVFGNFEEAKVTWTELANTLWDIFAGPLDNVIEKMEGAFDPSGYDSFTQYLKDAGVELDIFEKSLVEIAKKNGLVSDSLIESGDAIRYLIDHNLFSGKLVSQALDSLTGDVEAFGEKTVDVGSQLEYFQRMVDEVWSGDWGNGEERIRRLTEAGHDYYAIQSLVEKTVDHHRLSMEEVSEVVGEYGESVENLSDAQLENLGYTEDQIEAIRQLAKEATNSESSLAELIDKIQKPSGRELFIDSFRNALTGLQEIISSVSKAWHNIFPESTSDTIYNLIEKIHDLSELLVPSNYDEHTMFKVIDGEAVSFSVTLDKIERSLTGVFAVLDIIKMITGGALKTGLAVIKSILDEIDFSLLDFTANIGDNIVAFRDWLKEGDRLESFFNTVGSVISEGIDDVKNWIESVWKIESVQKVVTKIQTVFNNFVNKIKNEFNGTTRIFGAFIDRIKSLDGFTLENIITVLKDFWNNIIGYFVDFNKIQSTFVSKWKEIELKVRNALGSIGSYADVCKSKVQEFVGVFGEKVDQNKGTIAAIIFGGLLFGVYKSLKKLSGIGALIKSVVNPLESLTNVFDTFSKTLKSVQLLIIAGSIIMLAYAIEKLSKLTWEELGKGVGSVVILLGALTGLMVVLNKLSPVLMKVDMSKIGFGLLAIASAVWILVNALEKLNSMVLSKDWETKVWILVGILSALMVAVGLLGRYGGNFQSGIFSIISLAAGVLILVKTFEELLTFMSSDFSEKAFKSSLESLGACVLSLMALMGFMRLSGASFGGGLGLLLMVTSFRLLVKFFMEIADSEIPREKIQKALSNLEDFIFAFAGLMLLTRLAGKNAGKAGAMIFAIGTSVLMIVAAIKIIEGISSRGIAKGVIVLSVIMSFFALLVKVSEKVGKDAAKAGVMLIAASAAILILIGCIALISLLTPEQLVKGVATITALGIILAGLMYVTKYTNATKESIKTIIALTVAVGVMAIAVGVLAAIPPDRVAVATASLALMVGMFSLLILAVDHAVIDKSDIAPLYLISGVVAVLALIIGLLCGLGQNLDQALQVSSALSLLLMAISVSLLIIGHTKAIAPTALVALAVITIVVGAIAGILGLFLSLSGNTDKALTVANAITEILLAMSIVLVICAAIGTMGPAALIGAGSLLAILAAFGLVAVACSDFANAADRDKIISGFDVLHLIAEGIGGIIGAFAGGIINGFAEALTGLDSLATELSDFMSKIGPFIMGAKMIDGQAVSNVANIASIITTLTGASVLDGISKIFNGGQSSLSKFGSELIPFGEDLKSFAKGLDGISDYQTDIDAAATAMTSIGNMAKSIPNSGGLLGSIVGENDLGNFGTNLVSFGRKLKAFAKSIEGISNTTIISDARAAASATDYLVALAEKLPNDGGALGWIVGENDLGNFGGHLSLFGAGLSTFATNITGLGTSTLVKDAEVAASAATYVVDIANSLKNSSGVWQEVFGGGSDMGDFSANLPGFGEAIKKYVEELEGVSSKKSDIFYVNQIVDRFVSMATDISNIGAFGDDLVQFAKDIKDFADKFKDTDFGDDFSDKVGEFCTNVEKLYSLNLEENFVNISNKAADSIKRLANAIPQIGKDFADSVSEALDGALISTFFYYTKFWNVGSDLMKSLIEGFTYMEWFTFVVTNTINSAQSNAYTNNVGRFWYTGNYFALAMINGFKSFSLSDSMAVLVYNAQVAMYNNNIDRFWYSGVYFVDGLINGMDYRAYAASLAGTRLANVIINATRRAFDEHSPSKEGEEIGEFFDLGVIRGIINKAVLAADAGKYLGERTIFGLESAIKTASDIIDNGIDSQPAIRPILDLSDIKDGARALYSSFGKKVSIGLNTAKEHVNSIGRTRKDSNNKNSENQNGSYGNTYSFTQNNYSPKALSRIDIYRQTKNQFAAMERATKR